ncbi:SDR family NAD(P)-dependent oxidoreductase [Nonomuraea jabiensis]|uniref:SDR family NAD(P)-dependent oxidoreductase n=1 Tax=Nonomuraea jabiensis TaxID=882448 RepID=UPI00342D1178
MTGTLRRITRHRQSGPRCKGIGAHLVDAYRKLGYAVVATSRTIAPSHDAGVLTVQGDIADPATAERVITAALERFDALINNAGIFVAKPFTDYALGDYAAVTGVNVRAALDTGLRRLGTDHHAPHTSSCLRPTSPTSAPSRAAPPSGTDRPAPAPTARACRVLHGPVGPAA